LPKAIEETRKRVHESLNIASHPTLTLSENMNSMQANVLLASGVDYA
jgi:hypothetical protein